MFLWIFLPASLMLMKVVLFQSTSSKEKKPVVY
jgi:hypothetical protein